jgi:hypothetical protein
VAIKKQSADVKAKPCLFFSVINIRMRCGMAEQAGKTGMVAFQTALRTKNMEILFAKIWKK